MLLLWGDEVSPGSSPAAQRAAQPGAPHHAGQRPLRVGRDRVAVVQAVRVDDEGVVGGEDGEVGVVAALDAALVLQPGDLRRPLGHPPDDVEQTLSGKAPAGVAAAAVVAGIPVVTVSGRLALSEEKLRAAGIRQAYALTDIEPDVARCLAEPGPILERLAQRLARDWLSE